MIGNVTFVELSIYDSIFPLVSGYLQAYACQEPEIKKGYRFEKYSVTVRTPYQEILRNLQRSDSDVYAFSCYIWNMGLVKALIKSLLETKPHAHFILGGPQVMHHASHYLTPQYENVVLCNGEGERTFSEFLKELTNSRPDFSSVRGLSFYRDGEIVTTENHERIKNMDEIPSPFLSGVFDRQYGTTIFETNRGCPFSCGFCYWGAATNSKVFSFSEERVRDELTWLSQNNCVLLYIADANWGIYPRDIEFSKHIADLSKRNKMPNIIYYSAAKNRPERITEITEIFANAGIITSQAVSLQTMSETSLEIIDRKNIKLSAYAELQERLNQKKINSYTELIWPLPGETLSSLKEGIDKLCESRADTIIIYPQILLHNTTLYKKRDELGFVTKRIDEEVGEVEIVIQTADVSRLECEDGMRFFYAIHLLHNTRSLSAVIGYLNKHRGIKYSALFSAFVDFWKKYKDNPIVAFCEKSIREYDYYEVFNIGKVVHFALHENRDDYDELLYQFASSQDWWRDAEPRALFEIDLINKPYLYSNTPIKVSSRLFNRLRVLEASSRSYVVEIPETYLPLLGEFIGMDEIGKQAGNVFRVDHKRLQYPFMKSKGLDQNAGYCHGMVMRIANVLPVWTVVRPPEVNG